MVIIYYTLHIVWPNDSKLTFDYRQKNNLHYILYKLELSLTLTLPM